jgi:hypothetical protein
MYDQSLPLACTIIGRLLVLSSIVAGYWWGKVFAIRTLSVLMIAILYSRIISGYSYWCLYQFELLKRDADTGRGWCGYDLPSELVRHFCCLALCALFLRARTGLFA